MSVDSLMMTRGAGTLFARFRFPTIGYLSLVGLPVALTFALLSLTDVAHRDGNVGPSTRQESLGVAHVVCPSKRPIVPWEKLAPGRLPLGSLAYTKPGALCLYKSLDNSDARLSATRMLTIPDTRFAIRALKSGASSARGVRHCSNLRRPTFLLVLRSSSGQDLHLLVSQTYCTELIRGHRVWTFDATGGFKQLVQGKWQGKG